MNKILKVAEQQVASHMGETYTIPVVPGCIVILCADGHFKAVDEKVTLTPEGPHRGYHATKALLWRAKPEVYFAAAEEKDLAALDSRGKTVEMYALSVEAADWPCKDEYDSSIRIPSSLGQSDTRPVQRKKPVEIKDKKVSEIKRGDSL